MTVKQIRTFIKNKDLIDRRRKEIFKGAAELFLKKGYGQTSMQDLAQFLGLSKYQLYQYIGSKDDIIHLIVEYSGNYDRAIYRKILEDDKELSAIDSLSNAIALYGESIDTNQDIHNFLNHVIPSFPKEYRIKMFEVYEEIVDIFKDIIRKGINSGEFKEVDIDIVAHDIVLQIQAWAHRRWLLKKKFGYKEYIKRVTESVLILLVDNGLRNDSLSVSNAQLKRG